MRAPLETARQCRTLLGASGITLEYPVLRHASNLESVLTYEGTEEVHQLAVGKAVAATRPSALRRRLRHRTFVAIRPLSAVSSDRSAYL